MSAEEPKSTQPEEPLPTRTAEGVADPGEGARPLRVVPGDRIGPYHVLQLLGEGGFGAVYQCEQHEPVRRRVAVKVIKAGMDTAEVVARFRAERQALAMMEHPSIAKVFEASATAEGRPYFVMEYVKGVPITEYCSEHKLDLRARLKLFAKVCDAVHHAHQKGIIHRDLKPGNILVGTDGGREPNPKIIDFGIAKATSQQLTEQTIFTQFGQMVGTPLYMSPEQAGISSEDIDTRSDVYSLGVVLYQLICGKLPFGPEVLRERGYLEMQRVIREEDPPRPSTQITTQAKQASEETSRIALERQTSIQDLAKTLKRELEWIPLKALRKDRTERYSTAEALADDVRRYLAGDLLEAGPESASYRLKKLARRHRGPVIAASLISLSLIAGIIVSLNFAVEAKIANQKTRLALSQATESGLEAEKQATIARDQAVLAEESRDAAELEAEKARALAGFLGELLTSVQPEIAQTLDKQLMLMVFRNAIEKLDAGEVSFPQVEIELRNYIALALERIEDYALSLEQFEKIQELENKVRGEDDPLAIAVGISRGKLLSWMGKQEEALELWRVTRERLLEVEGSDRTLSDTATGFMAGVYSQMGRSDEAIALYEGVLKDSIERLGPRHPHTSLAYSSLGYEYDKAGRYEESLSSWEKHHELNSELHGPDDPSALDALKQIAGVYWSMGETEIAITRYKELLPRYREILSPTHPSYSLLIFNLAGIYYSLERFEEALPLLMEAYTLNKGIFGPAHNFTLSASAGVEMCLRNLDRLGEALEFGDEILQALLESEEHGMHGPDTLRQIEGQIALLKRLLGRAPTEELQTSLERHEALKREIITNLEESGG